MDKERRETNSGPGWSRVGMASVAGNLPELLMSHVMAEGRWHLLIEDGPEAGRYVQTLTDEDGDIHLECVSNRFLTDADKLFSDEEAMLRILGFNEPTPGPDSTRPNWWYDSEGLDVITACSVIVEVLFGIFGITLDDPVWLLQRELVPTTSGTES